MKLKSKALMTGIAAVALTALGLVAASPASAHTNNMYTYVYYDNTTEQSGYATYGKADGVATLLPTTYDPEEITIRGIEVHGEQGTEIGFWDGPYVTGWNHTTGEIDDVELFAYLADESLEFNDFVGLDTLNDGTTVTVVQYYSPGGGEIPVPVEHWAIASVNSGTGELIPLVEIFDAISVDLQLIDEPTSLATDPATGITYVFLQNPAGEVEFLPVDVATGTVGEPTLFQGEYFVEGEINGADFDPGDGSLYFNFDNFENEAYELLKLGAPSTWVTAEPTYISMAPGNYDEMFIAQKALTIEYAALAATGAEIPVAVWLIAGTVAVLAGGVTLMVARRRSEAGTV